MNMSLDFIELEGGGYGLIQPGAGHRVDEAFSMTTQQVLHCLGKVYVFCLVMPRVPLMRLTVLAVLDHELNHLI